MHHLLYGFIVIPFDFEVGYLAVSLGGGNPVMSQEILDGGQVRIGIEELGCHGVPELMARRR